MYMLEIPPIKMLHRQSSSFPSYHITYKWVVTDVMLGGILCGFYNNNDNKVSGFCGKESFSLEFIHLHKSPFSMSAS